MLLVWFGWGHGLLVLILFKHVVKDVIVLCGVYCEVVSLCVRIPVVCDTFG